MGRPSKYTPELGKRICDELAKGTPLRTICAMEGMPGYSTVREWEQRRPEFAAISTRAREIGCHAMADECIEIADDGRNDWMEVNDEENAGYRFNGEHAQRSKLRIETRMRLLGKWLPKVYGDKVQQELTGPNGTPLQTAPVFNVTVKG